MPDRVVVFVDYQNVYRGARESFFPLQTSHCNGQVDPIKLGQLLVTRSPYPRTLAQVRVYRGQPDSSRDPKGYAACSRQCATWSRAGVDVTTRTLRYPPGWPGGVPGNKPQEKGIDVALAIDYAIMAIRGEYDVGILMSSDTDLKPALEIVSGLPDIRAEVCAWSVAGSHSRRLSISGPKLWCHWLDAGDFAAVADTTDYNVA